MAVIHPEEETHGSGSLATPHKGIFILNVTINQSILTKLYSTKDNTFVIGSLSLLFTSQDPGARVDALSNRLNNRIICLGQERGLMKEISCFVQECKYLTYKCNHSD